VPRKKSRPPKIGALDKSEVTLALRARLRSRKAKWDLREGFAEKHLVRRMLAVADAALHATKVREITFDGATLLRQIALLAQQLAAQGCETAYDDARRAVLAPIAAVLGQEPVLFANKLVWLEPDFEISLVALREIAARQYPVLNRKDLAAVTDYIVRLQDPNESEEERRVRRARLVTPQQQLEAQAAVSVFEDETPI
jgi:hypothetical protein